VLKGFPDDRCQCPHWGYVFKGKLTWRFADQEEVFEAGDAFYVPPGHTPVAAAGFSSPLRRRGDSFPGQNTSGQPAPAIRLERG
jgi:hypothetical protein